MTRHGALGLFALTLLAGWAGVASAQSAVDPALPAYYRTNEPLKGKITLIGSDTMSSVASIWAENFRKIYPDVVIEVQVEGSANAVKSVTNGQATFGLLSRQVLADEAEVFQKKFGYPPQVLTPSLESMAIYVNRENPISSLTLAQLDAIYSTTLKRGAGKTIRTWGELGLTGKWANTPIICHGRSPSTGSQVYFQAAVLGGGKFREDMVSDRTNIDLAKAVAADPRAIGFAGSIYELPETKAVPISYRDGTPAIPVLTTEYPLVRPLQLVVNRNPNAELPPLQREFVRYIFSKQGQEDVVIGGFQPIPAKPAQIAIQSIGVHTLN